METKRCNACLEEKELCKFSKDKGRPQGVSDKCRKCHSDKKLSVRFVDPVGESKICETCLFSKDLSLFKKRKGRNYTHEPRCMQCTKEGKLIDKKIFIEDTKKCSICGEYKNFENYQQCKSCVNGIIAHCKECDVIRSKKYRESISKDEKKKRKQEEYERNRESYIKRAKIWTDNNRERRNKSIRSWTKTRMSEDPLYKLKNNISSLIRITFTKNLDGIYSKNSKTIDIIGCEIEKLREHLESQFLPWMNWKNYGNCENNEYNCTWHLDHIIPISIAQTEEEIYLLNHWSNFQPLCSLVNTKDKSNMVYPLTNLELKITILEDKTIIKNE